MRVLLLLALALGGCLGQVMPTVDPADPPNPPVGGPMPGDAALERDGGDVPADLGPPSPDLAPSTNQGATQAEVCMRWQTSAEVPASFFSKTTATCDDGALTADGTASAVARINFYRWLVGLGPVMASASANNLAQKCALVSAWNPAGVQAHSPGPSAECYTSEGAQGAASSNIAWGVGSPAGAIDQWIEDNGNATTMGHRRWILNPPLDPIGFGLYVGGDSGYGSAACLQIFNQQGTGPRPAFVALPPAGFVPLELAQGTWTFSGDGYNFSSPTVSVTRLSDGASLAVTIQPVQNPGGFSYPDATSWRPSGWTPVAGQTYRVAITAGTKSATYDVKPVGCP